MATETWPSDLCSILREGYSQQIAPDVRRTEYEDGSILQKKSKSRTLLVRSFNILVKDEDLPELFNWLQDHAHEYFNFADLDGTTRDCRIRGGVGSVEFRAVSGPQRMDGDKVYHQATIELEGYL